MATASKTTPMFRQYDALKREHPDSILLFRMGDFYEMFHGDAKVASRILELTLTARGKGTDNVVPMCGFPHHQLDTYTSRLVRAQQKVAICDQVEDPRKAKGLVRREVVRVVTPGTVNEPGQVDGKSNLWMAGVAASGGRPGAAFLDASTGEFVAWDCPADTADPWAELAARLREFAPREIVYPEGFGWNERFRRDRTEGAVLTEAEPFAFAGGEARKLLERQFDVSTLDGFGFRDRPSAVAAAGGLLQYLQDTQKCGLEHIDSLRVHEPTRHLLLDAATRRNLELERSVRDGGVAGSLFCALDTTLTPAGGRLLRRWLLAPLLDPTEITERLDAVDGWVGASSLRAELRERLNGIYDIERLVSRAVAGTAGPRELIGLKSSLDRVPDVMLLLGEVGAALVRRTLDGLDPCADVVRRIGGALVDDPPATLRDGGFIRPGLNPELDELLAIRRDARSFIVSLEAAERESTKISSLKVRFNKVFGYFIEVSKSNLHLVPDHYRRKQTIANGERYVTPQLKDYEAKILNAQERIETLEWELFQALRSDVAAQAPRLKAVARATALLDVLAGFAETAADGGYCRPEVDDGRQLRIRGGRHPVVEQNLVDTRFVPNDTALEAGARAVAVLTGPNMGGKSTYLRQVALITLMAQAGSFVPAEEASIGVVDRIFCRVGASDSLAEGQSTFMVEMSETANILHHATARSLLLLDEIGRGTSTFDGLSIAWAVVEHLDAVEDGAPRTLFATHYHELTELAVELGSVVNLRMAVREQGDTVAFLHRVEDGASDRSYGIHVARLAGVPSAVVQRAGEILSNLERDEYGGDGLPRRARKDGAGLRDGRSVQPSLFADSPQPDQPSATAAEILARLRRQDLDRLTPIDALNLVASWQRKLSGDETG